MVVIARARLWSKLGVVCTMLTTVACAPLLVGDCSVPLPDDTGSHLFVDEWRIEVDAEFPYMVDGDLNIAGIGIGGLLQNENFANRGDVIVKNNGPEGRILVEMRRFTWRATEEDAQKDFETTELLAYVGSLKPPDEIPDENKCGYPDRDDPDTVSPWQDACSIRVYYRGQIQPMRLGADLRVTLPASYRGATVVTTDDNDESEDYLDRGNVCAEDLFASLDAELESGTAYVLFDREATPVPCLAGDGEGCTSFGSTGVRTTGSPSVVIDVAQDLWAELCLNSEGDIDVDWPAAHVDPPDESCKVNGEANRPDGFTPGEEGPYEIQASGHTVHLCAGCLHPSTCDELLAELESDQG